MENLYRIEEFATTGWELISEDEVQLTKEVCTQHLNNYLSQGMNPNLIRVVVDVWVSSFSTKGL